MRKSEFKKLQDRINYLEERIRIDNENQWRHYRNSSR
jgi:hypothetical protein